MLLKISGSPAEDLADQYLRWMRNQTERLRRLHAGQRAGVGHEGLLSLLNATDELDRRDLEIMLNYNSSRGPETAPPCYCGGAWQEVRTCRSLSVGGE